MSRKRTLLSIACLATLLLVCSCKDKNKPNYPVVNVEFPSQEDVHIYGEYVGRIRAVSFVEIHARVEGFLENMMFEEGKKVIQHAPLFVINPDRYRARVEKAKAQLKKSEAQAAKAKRDVERLKPLYEQRAASQLDLDNALASLDDAQANVAMNKADLEQAELELSYTVVRSPITGYISERYVDVGALVGPGTKSKLAAVVKSDTVFVDFKMTALDYLKAESRNIKFGEQDSTRSWQPTVNITLADGSEYPIAGMVDFADPLVDSHTGTFGVRAKLANNSQKLLPGQYTKVRLLLDVMEQSVVVPRKAISIEKGGAFIFVIRRDSVAEKRFVEIGHEYDNNVVISRGLALNEQVVTEGYHKLIPGIKVQPRTPEQQQLEANKEEEAE